MRIFDLSLDISQGGLGFELDLDPLAVAIRVRLLRMFIVSLSFSLYWPIGFIDIQEGKERYHFFMLKRWRTGHDALNMHGRMNMVALGPFLFYVFDMLDPQLVTPE